MNPMELCRRYKRCNVSHCPLDPNNGKVISYPDDRQCTLPEEELNKIKKEAERLK